MQVLRTSFFLLVLGNLLLFAWGQGYLGPKGDAGEAERLAGQIDPDKLRIAGKGVPSPRPPAPVREECRLLTGLERETAEKLVALIGARDAQLKVVQRPVEEPKSWWVHIPPQQNNAQADKKAAELSRIHVRDFYVVRESGPNQYAISLGLFKNEEAALEYLEALQKKGVKSARVLGRETPVDKAVVEVRGSPEGVAKVLADLPAELNAPPPGACAQARP